MIHVLLSFLGKLNPTTVSPMTGSTPRRSGWVDDFWILPDISTRAGRGYAAH
jgi:hypothetical protein